MSEIVISPFTTQSPDQIFDLLLPIQQQEFKIAVTRQDQGDIETIPEFYQKSNGNFWVAMDKNVVVGSIALKDIGNGQVALRKMFVRAGYRGKATGIATRLLEEAIQWAVEKGVREIFLGTTSAFLAAHRFYEKNGFGEIAKTELPAAFPVMAIDSKFYLLRLNGIPA